MADGGENIGSTGQPAAAGGAAPVRDRHAAPWTPRRIIKPLASLRLTVVLFALAVFLVFVGTLAQVDKGIWTVMDQYFRTGLAWVELSDLLPAGYELPGAIPYPGGWLLGGLMLVNLLAAHAVRFKMNWKRSGIFLIHAGIIVMLLSEGVTGWFAVEANLSLDEGESRNFVAVRRDYELAVIRGSGDQQTATVVPDSKLKSAMSAGRAISHELLPFEIAVNSYMKNSGLVNAEQLGDAARQPIIRMGGDRLAVMPRQEVSGASGEQSANAPAVDITLRRKSGGGSIGSARLSLWHQRVGQPYELTRDGTRYRLFFRRERQYKPYTMHLIDFKHDKYVGTDKPKNFESVIRLVDPSRNVDRRVRVYMNHPLRYRGETFYQSSFKPGDRGTVLQVVRNPGWWMPYLACIMVGVGLIVHFGMTLSRFLRKERKQRAE